MNKPIDVLRKLVEQIENGNLTDDHDHSFNLNSAFIDAQVFLSAAVWEPMMRIVWSGIWGNVIEDEITQDTVRYGTASERRGIPSVWSKVVVRDTNTAKIVLADAILAVQEAPNKPTEKHLKRGSGTT